MNLDVFIKKYSGKGVDFDLNGKFWCVDLARQYVKEVLQLPQFSLVKGAADIWDLNLSNQYIKIANTPDGIPEKGDIILWSNKSGGGYGHVAIYLHGDVNSFTSLDANWPTGSLTHEQRHYYKNVLGWLRPKGDQGNNPNSMTNELQVCLDLHGKLVDENVKLKKDMETLKTNADNAKADFATQKRDLEALVRNLTKALEKAESKHQDYQETLGDVVGCGIAKIEEEIIRLIKYEDTASKEIKVLKKGELHYEKRMIELQGEIDKLKVKLQAKDLSQEDARLMIRELLKRLLQIVRR